MVIQRRQMPVEETDKLCGGEGIARLVSLAPAETMRNLRVLKEVTLEPGVKIGYHKHEGETEFFLIRSGAGLLNDNGREVMVHAGDVVITGNGSSHSLLNTGKKKLVFYAIIATY
ncbi:MAG: cupin domain-containing protein [Spirochaetaceae bacterium]|jgi:mannose-6-phosphate isomerase-like protein (cupin superfamily)|nr:cupin domain-containing protein [Spirochaetaceae bacterium]